MKAAWLLLGVVGSTAANAHPSAPEPVIAASGAFFALSVADLEASARWYVEKLGLRVVIQSPKQGKAAATVLEGGGLMVELVQHDDARPLSVAAPGAEGSISIHGAFKVGVLVANYQQALDSLRARQVAIAFGPFPARGEQRANVIVKDNAGNLIQLIAR